MQGKTYLLLIPALLLAAIMLLVQCGDSDDTTGPVESQTEAVLCVTRDSCTMRAVCDTSALVWVRDCGDSSSVDWYATTNQDWLSVSVDSGTTPATFSIIADYNGTDGERSGTVTVTSPVADSTRHITVVQKRFLQFAGSYDTPGNSNGVFAVDNHVFVADGYAGLTKIDVTDPSNPTLIESCYTGGFSFDVVVFEGLAYVADYYGGLKIITHETIIGSYETFSFSAIGVSCSGDYAWVAAEDELLKIDISNPEEPTLEYYWGARHYATGVFVNFGTVYMADGGLRVLGGGICLLPGGTAEQLFVVGDYAYVAAGAGGLQIVDVSDKASPHVVGSYVTSGEAHDVHVYGNYAFVVDGDGLHVVDVTNPTTPTLAAYYETPGLAWGVYVAEGLAFVGDSDDGLQVLEVGF